MHESVLACTCVQVLALDGRLCPCYRRPYCSSSLIKQVLELGCLTSWHTQHRLHFL